MKVYISADMEGITGVTHWDEVDQGKHSYPKFQKQMSLEVAAACIGAKKGGATDDARKDGSQQGRERTHLNGQGIPPGRVSRQSLSRCHY